MRERASKIDETRRRITEAAVRLHTSVGPSEASFAAVADEAGVTRLTLYRHFATREELFAACMSHWRDAHPPPDPAAWSAIEPFERRLRRAISDLYRWYAENADDLYPVYRDVTATPEGAHRARRDAIERMAAHVIGADATDRRAVRAAVHHVLGYWTWRSLAVDEGCSADEAVDLAVRFVLAASRARPAPSSAGVSAVTRSSPPGGSRERSRTRP
jgi:AcrR family transcriptional regulator